MLGETDHRTLLADIVADAKALGADAADAACFESRSLSVSRRLGAPETIERSEAIEVGLRVFVGRRQAIVSSTDLSAAALSALIERAVAMARVVPEDPYCGLAEPGDLASEDVDVDGYDAETPSVDDLMSRAAVAEDAALGEPGITNSEGAEASWSVGRTTVVASNGFARSRRRSHQSLAVSVLAGEGTAMERDYEYTSAVYGADLDVAEAVGKAAARRALRRLHPRKAGSAQVPVVFEARAARSLVGHLAAAVNGAAVARGTTFLKDKLGTRIFPADVTIVDDPLRRRGLRSRSFDGEGLPTRRLAVVDQGVLTTWILDLRSARQVGLASTGHAARGPSALPAPAPSNLYLEPGTLTPAALIADIREGLFVTELIGFGVNGVTGDYSRGAQGFWIENGECAYPVSEVTVAGHLLEMFARLTAADDLMFRYGTDAPTVRIDGMTVAGR
jgi:PmbA protein